MLPATKTNPSGASPFFFDIKTIFVMNTEGKPLATKRITK